jgi:hypothetical protein
VTGTADEKTGTTGRRDKEWKIDFQSPVQVAPDSSAGKALDALIDGELKLLAIYDARQVPRIPGRRHWRRRRLHCPP